MTTRIRMRTEYELDLREPIFMSPPTMLSTIYAIKIICRAILKFTSLQGHRISEQLLRKIH